MIDVFPTLVELTDGNVPASCEGKSFESVLERPEDPFREFALSQYPRGSTMGFSMRTDRWRYTEWINSKTKSIVARELYDHQTSQRPLQSVANNPEHAKLIATLSQQLDSAGRIAKTLTRQK
jgi:iduronate 2-sulfatase